MLCGVIGTFRSGEARVEWGKKGVGRAGVRVVIYKT